MTFSVMSHLFLGIKRPPALQCFQVEVSKSIEDYEISMTEPLHDFKNVVNRVISEVPHAAQDPKLKDIITQVLEDLNGE